MQKPAALYTPIDSETEKFAGLVIDSVYSVHKNLGPGLLESIYETCLCYELGKRGLKYDRQVSVPILYDGVKLLMSWLKSKLSASLRLSMRCFRFTRPNC